MPNPAPTEITVLLSELAAGRREAADELLPLVYPQLRALAASYLQRERDAWTLQPTALVHDAYIRLVGEKGGSFQDRAHFMAIAARAMRQILIEGARRKDSLKRGGEIERVTLAEGLGSDPDASSTLDVIALDAALEELARLHERQARVVELRFFGGLSLGETAAVLGVAESTVSDDWYVARLFLARALG